MLHSDLDHLVVTAPSLTIGVEYVRDILGIAPQVGGEHPRMGTHNSLLKLGHALYLEVIAANPNAPKPDRPRWYQLDEVTSNTAPRLAAWVARTNDIRAAAAAAPFPMGNIEAMSRGQLRWLITIPGDGRLPFDGIAPTLIEWHTSTHPATALRDAGCTLIRLEGFHPLAVKVSELLRAVGFQNDSSLYSILPGEQPRLTANIQTPFGVRQLNSA